MTPRDSDGLGTWAKHPVSVLLFLAAWSGFLACWALGLLPNGEWPPPPQAEEPQRFTTAEWWSRLRWAMVVPTVLVGAGLVLLLRRLLRRPEG
jgi:hypothetical protein